MSPFLQKFDSVSDLLSAYKDFMGGSSTNNVESTRDESDKSAPTSDATLKTDDSLAMSILTDAISLVTASNDDQVIDVDEESTEVVDVSSYLPDKCESKVASNLQSLLSMSSLDDLIPEFEEGMRNLQIGKDKGSFTLDQKTKSLTGRWFSGKSDANAKSSEDDGTTEYIERNSHVRIEVSEGGNTQKTDFRVLGIYTKHYNKWYLCDIGRQPWKKGGKNGNYRILAKMLSYDSAFGNYKEITSIDSSIWTNKSIYVLCDPDNIASLFGKFQQEKM